MTDIDRALLSMGYRLATIGEFSGYLKPWGYSMIVVDPVNRTISHFFEGENSETFLMESAEISEEGPLSSIKEFELFLHRCGETGSNYEFLTMEQQMEI